MVADTSGPKMAPLYVSDSHAPFVRLALVLAIPGALLMTATWVVTGDRVMLVPALAAWLWTGVGWAMIRTGRENGPLMLGIAALQVTTWGAVAQVHPVHMLSSVALILIGVATILFVHGTATWFLLGYSAFIAVVHVLWLGWTQDAVAEAAVSVLGFAVGSLGLWWIRDHSMDAASRFVNLFERAPVSLWEEDFSEVGEWLDGLRAQGVTDLRSFLNDNPDALREGMSRIEVLRVNEEAANLLEVPDPTALVGRIKPETFSDDALPSMLAQFEAIWEGRDHVTTEVRRGFTVRGNPLDGLLHWSVPSRFGKPDLSRVIVSVVDVTAMHDARRELEGSLKSKDELIATVSHELRTPLTTVVGLSSELSDSYDNFSREEAHELLAMIAEQSAEVATIVEDLLVAARAESGLLEVQLEPVDLHFEAKSTLRGLDIEADVDCHTVGVVPPVLADSGRVRQILRNLLVNARRYGTDPVRVVVRSEEQRVMVEVRDRGEPLPADERHAIFDRYYRARQTPGMTASVGLGLTVSRELARIMDGELTYDHDGESVFTLSLPTVVAASVEVAS